MQKPVETGKPILKHIPQSLKSASFSGSELFDGIDLNKAKIKFKKGKRNQDKKALCGKILNAFMDMVIEDVVENNVVFKTFSEKRPVLISVRLVEGDKFKRGCQFGKYPGLDFLKTNFTAPEVTFTFWITTGELSVPFFFKKIETREWLYKNANDGKYN